jgi:hypothetical protein
MKHSYLKHVGCTQPGCVYCDGGLAFCTTCGAAEGELTTECPGVRTTESQRQAVMAGTLDFVDGVWKVR